MFNDNWPASLYLLSSMYIPCSCDSRYHSIMKNLEEKETRESAEKLELVLESLTKIKVAS